MTLKEPNYVQDLAGCPGLTWRGLASRMGVNDLRRLQLRLPAGPAHRRKSGGKGNRAPGANGG